MSIFSYSESSEESSIRSEPNESNIDNSESNITITYNTRSKRRLESFEDSENSGDFNIGVKKRKKYIARDVVPGMPKYHQRVEIILLSDVYKDGEITIIDTPNFEVCAMVIKHHKALLEVEPTRRFKLIFLHKI